VHTDDITRRCSWFAGRAAAAWPSEPRLRGDRVQQTSTRQVSTHYRDQATRRSPPPRPNIEMRLTIEPLRQGCDARANQSLWLYAPVDVEEIVGIVLPLDFDQLIVVLAVVVSNLAVIIVLHEVDVSARFRIRSHRLVVVTHPLDPLRILGGIGPRR
jgi:hypothetical protein